MKLKAALVVGLMIALAANQADAHRRNAPPAPAPTFPTFPGIPNVPGFPTLPPNLPPPGKFDPRGGPEVPFPMSITLPFPWGNIEGMWKVVTNDGTQILFSFSVETDKDGKQYLRVLQIDANTQAVLAEGVGIAIENDKLVRAAMQSKVSHSSYMLFVGSYKNQGQQALGGIVSKAITVLTVRPFTDLMGGQDVQVVVQKVSNAPYAIRQCTNAPDDSSDDQQ